METRTIEARETEKTWAEEDWKTFILREPDTFLGSGAIVPEFERVLEPRSGNIVFEEVIGSQACKHTFTESLSNAQDSILRARNEDLPVHSISVKFINQKIIEIINIGADIISVRKNERGVWIPESVLGNLLSGSNSKAKNKVWIGKNGFGGTLTNIFSKEFRVEVWDHVRNLYYMQEWHDNCVKKTDQPLIIPNGKEHFPGHENIPESCGGVRIVYELDFEKFGMDTNYYNDNMMKFYARKVLDASLVTRVPVSLHWTDLEGNVVMDQVFDVPDIEAYSERFFKEKPANFIVYKPAFPANYRPPQTEGVVAEVQAIIYDTPDEGFTFSFVNGQPTEFGGIHVDELSKMVCKYVISKVEEANDIKEKDGIKLLPADVMAHMTVFVYAVVPDPKFTSQTKNRLTSPKPAVRWYESAIEKVSGWSVITAMNDTLESKRKRLLSKTDGKKVRRINIPKAEDANLAGSVDSHRCTIWFCEGDSAKNYALTLLELLEGGRNYNGIYPLSGKILNVMKANTDQMARSKQITEIKIMMGLQEGVDYSVFENLRQLRYGKVGILTDMDMDGSHIKYLLEVLFGTRFAGLIMSQNLVSWLSPIIRARKGKQTLRFFSMADFHSWKSSKTPSDMKKWTIKYYKGLGGSTDADVKEDVESPHIEVPIFDEMAKDSLQLAFDQKMIQRRKEWINNFIRKPASEQQNPLELSSFNFERANVSLGEFLNKIVPGESQAFGKKKKKIHIPLPSEVTTDTTTITTDEHNPQHTLMLERKTITEGIYGEYMAFNLLTLKRAIPSEIDGMKVSERKILWTALKFLKDGDEIKTAQFGNIAAKETDYAHNEQCLERVISGMAQDFPTSNNLPQFKGNGQFGSQYRPKASAGRYTHIQKAFWLRHVYRQEDDAILPMVFDEGRETEPEHLIPIIPMAMVNGCCGVANGFSTFIPQYNPLDIIHHIRKIITGEQTDARHMVPWYRNWKGNIELLVEDTPDQRVIGMQAFGCYEQDTKSSYVKITELPIGMSGENYRKKLNMWRDNRSGVKKQDVPGEKKTVTDSRSIKDFNNLSKKNEMLFEIIGCDDPSYESLGLVKRLGLTNMNLLESLNQNYDAKANVIQGQTREPYIPRKYESLQEYLEKFCKIRLYYYNIRKNHMIKVKKEEIDTLRSKHAFIKDVVDKVIDVFHWAEEDILKAMSERGHAETLYTQTPIRRFSPAEVSKLAEQIELETQTLKKIQETDVVTMWLNDLQEFEDAYTKVYKGEKRVVNRKVRVVKVKKGTKIQEDGLDDIMNMRDGEHTPETETYDDEPETTNA